MLKVRINTIFNRVKQYNKYFTAAFVFSLLTILWLSTSYANNQNMVRQKLTEDIQSLSDQYRLLNTAATQLQTAQRIETESKRLNLVKVQAENISYLAETDKTVALRD